MKINCLLVIFIPLLTLFGCKPDLLTDTPQAPLEFDAEFDGTFYLPGDLKATLWAESPQLYNPTNIDVDHRGRLWVTEAVNYREYNHQTQDQKSFSKGDRVLILEDTNGDGKCDLSKVFAQDEDLVAPTGIAVMGNQVLVSCSPHLILYTDENGDDVADHKEILLTGFGGLDHDHSLHSLTAGPDGNWYFNVGNAGPHHVTDRAGWSLNSGSIYTGDSPYNLTNEGNLKSDDGKVWVGGLALRIRPDATGMKVMGHNFRNSYELALDSYGNMWQNDNDDQVAANWVGYLMEGGNAGYFSADGSRTWQSDRKPDQSIFDAHWHQDTPGVMPAGDNTGAGSLTGMVFYEGEALGAQYQGMLLCAEAGKNAIYAYRPQMKGAGYELNRRKLFTSLESSIEDYQWSDYHEDTRRWFRPSDIAVGTDGSLYIADWYDPVIGDHQTQDTSAYGRIFRITPKDKQLTLPVLDFNTLDGQIAALLNPATHVRFMAWTRLKEQGESALPSIKKLLKSENPLYQARAIWLLPYLGEEGLKTVDKLLKKDENPHIRVTAFRALRAATDDILPYAEHAAEDPSAAVRREVAISLTNMPFEKIQPILLTLLESYQAGDRWNLEALGQAIQGNEEAIYPELLYEFGKDPLEWSPAMVELIWRLHPTGAADKLVLRAQARDLSYEERRQALDALANIPFEEAAMRMLHLANEGPVDLREPAAWWINMRKNNDWEPWKSSLVVNTQNTSPEMARLVRSAGKGTARYVNSNLSPGRIFAHSGDVQKGKRLFDWKCSTCHRFNGNGKEVGPNLSQISTKLNRATMVDAILNPAASIAFGYQPYQLKTHEGKSYIGFLLGKGETYILKDLRGKQHSLNQSEIASSEVLNRSLMPLPEGLGLNEKGVADIVAYLSDNNP